MHGLPRRVLASALTSKHGPELHVGVILRSPKGSILDDKVFQQHEPMSSLTTDVQSGIKAFILQVSRRTFVKALDESGAVIMVPGGQAELVHTWRFFKQKEFVIYTRHKGASSTLGTKVHLWPSATISASITVSITDAHKVRGKLWGCQSTCRENVSFSRGRNFLIDM